MDLPGCQVRKLRRVQCRQNLGLSAALSLFFGTTANRSRGAGLRFAVVRETPVNDVARREEIFSSSNPRYVAISASWTALDAKPAEWLTFRPSLTPIRHFDATPAATRCASHH
jgi:hypothetical protein